MQSLPDSLANGLYKHQIDAIANLKTGSILCGGVGSGKSRTSLFYFFSKESNNNPQKDLYIITTAEKRNRLDWQRECANFGLSTDRRSSFNNTCVFVDSWNNIAKYADVESAFFIFDEQRLVGSGVWVKAFLEISKHNNWILLSATPGDKWLDYIPLFIANGFYKNRTDFIRQHVVYKPFMRYPVIDRIVNTDHLEFIKNKIFIPMEYERETILIYKDIEVDFDMVRLSKLITFRWNEEADRPIKNSSELYFLIRKEINKHPSRLLEIKALIDKHQRIIVFYNFDYELDILKKLESNDIIIAELNGHKHESIPTSNKWVYLVQYTSGSEGWNCFDTNVVVFYSLNHSYRKMAQAAGRIDRMNTPFSNLYYYRLISNSFIDKSIVKSLQKKKNFNKANFNATLKTYLIIEGV